MGTDSGQRIWGWMSLLMITHLIIRLDGPFDDNALDHTFGWAVRKPIYALAQQNE